MTCQACAEDADEGPTLCEPHVQQLAQALALAAPVARALRKPDAVVAVKHGANAGRLKASWSAGSAGGRHHWWEAGRHVWAGIERELEDVALRATAPAPRVGGPGAETPLPFHAAASAVLTELRDLMATWARELGTEGEPVGGTVPAQAAFIAGHLDRVVAFEFAGSLFADLTDVLARAEHLVRPTSGHAATDRCFRCDARELLPGEFHQIGENGEMVCPRCLVDFKNVRTSMADMCDSTAAAAHLGTSMAAIRQHRCRNDFPAPDGMIGRRAWWYRSTLDQWKNSRRVPGRPAAS